MKRMKKVLFLTWGVEFGGLEVVLLDWLSGIDYSKVSVVLACRAPDLFREKLTEKGLKVELVQLRIPDGEPFWRTFPPWYRMFSSIRPDKIVFLEGVFAQFSLMAVLGAWWSIRSQVFLFLGGWGSDSPLGQPSNEKSKHAGGFLQGINRYGIKEVLKLRLRASLLRETFVASRALKNNLIVCFGYPRNRLSVFYHGVNIERFKASAVAGMEFRQAHGIPADAIVIVSHGRLARVKRPDRILKVFEILSREQPNIWLLITVYGPLKEEVERIAASSGARRCICLVGFQKDSSAILKAGAIYVMASDNEGFGVALIEAMATGLVCVATDCGGPREILVDEVNGFLVEASDDGVLNGLRRVLQLTDQARASLSENARKTAEERFEVHAAVRNALDALAIPRE
jgi:glycosyltransferase involved in cell wall biosynthesis